MRRFPLLPALVVLVLIATPVLAQGEPNPIDQFIAAVQAPENQEFISQFLRDPVPGKGAIEDPVGDFGHSTGQPPGYTPDFIDITSTWAIDLLPGAAPIFGPTNGTDPLWDIGNRQVDLPDGMSMHTFTNDSLTHDGSQFDDGAYLFGITTVGMPPVAHPGRCEYVVWLFDPSNPQVWVNQSSFPDDPAGGTNMAFGIGINPEGQGMSSTFTLDLDDSGFFQPRNEYDVRGFIFDDYVGILIPKSAVPAIGGVNFYTYCVEEGFSFSPEDTGSDQTGLIAMTPDDFGLVQIELVSTEEEVTPSSSSSSTSSSSTSSSSTSSTTSSTLGTVDETPTVAVATETEGGFPFGLVVGGGLLLLLLGWWLFVREDGDPCAELLAAWKAAQAKCDTAQTAADAAHEDCDDAQGDIEDLEEERKDLCREWPPACWGDNEDGGWIEDDQGTRVTSRDLHLRRQALGQVWSDYKAGKLTAQEVEAKWNEADTPEFREDMREKDAAAKGELAEIDADLTTAREVEKAACDAATKAQEAADTACADADTARRAYEKCVGAAVAAASGGGTDGEGEEGGTAGGGSTPGVVDGGPSESQPDPCEGEEPRKVERAGRADTFIVVVDFSMFIEAWAGTERNTEAGEQLVISLQQVAGELDVAGDLLSARQAGLHIGGGVNGYRAGKYVAGTAGVVRGGIGAVLAGADMTIDVPTSIPTAVLETLESVARLGGFIAGKVTEWMRNYQIMQARITYFTQRIVATPYTVWECKPGVGWVCIEKVWEFDVGRLRKRNGPKSKSMLGTSELDRWRMQREWERFAAIAANKIKNDARRLIEWRRTHEPGPCP